MVGSIGASSAALPFLKSCSPCASAVGGAPSAGQSSGIEKSGKGAERLSEDEKREVANLKARDREVRAHEQAHMAAGGPYAGAASYDTVRGPDGRQYAVGGEVQIDTSPAGDPRQTIAKMDVIIRAAMAPADPSPQDRQVAQAAYRARQQAQAELRAEKPVEENTVTAEGSDRAVAPGTAPPADRLLQALNAYASAGGAARSITFGRS